jgi:predicted acetyltransferase
MKVQLVPVAYDKKETLRNLLELYMYELSPYLDTIEINELGLFGYRTLDHYWTEDGRHPFFIYASEKLAGFVLVREFERLTEGKIKWLVSEFFILKKYQNQGIGRLAAHQVFDKLKGNWIVAQIERNIPSQLFWQKVISEYTKGQFTKTYLGKQPANEFESTAEGLS